MLPNLKRLLSAQANLNFYFSIVWFWYVAIRCNVLLILPELLQDSMKNFNQWMMEYEYFDHKLNYFAFMHVFTFYKLIYHYLQSVGNNLQIWYSKMAMTKELESIKNLLKISIQTPQFLMRPKEETDGYLNPTKRLVIYEVKTSYLWICWRY